MGVLRMSLEVLVDRWDRQGLAHPHVCESPWNVPGSSRGHWDRRDMYLWVGVLRMSATQTVPEILMVNLDMSVCLTVVCMYMYVNFSSSIC